MIEKLKRLDQLVEMIDDENLKEEIIDIMFETFTYYADNKKLKEELMFYYFLKLLTIWFPK